MPLKIQFCDRFVFVVLFSSFVIERIFYLVFSFLAIAVAKKDKNRSNTAEMLLCIDVYIRESSNRSQVLFYSVLFFLLYL